MIASTLCCQSLCNKDDIRGLGHHYIDYNNYKMYGEIQVRMEGQLGNHSAANVWCFWIECFKCKYEPTEVNSRKLQPIPNDATTSPLRGAANRTEYKAGGENNP